MGEMSGNKMTAAEWIKDTLHFSPAGGMTDMVFQDVRPFAKCADGFTLSIQHSRWHYCMPREDGRISVESVEIGFPSKEEPMLTEWKDMSGIYAYVPIEVVEAVVEKHGGIVGEAGCERN